MKTISTLIISAIGCAWISQATAQLNFSYSWSTLMAAGTNQPLYISWPTGIVVDELGNVYVVDNRTYTIAKLTRVGEGWATQTIAGLSGTPGSSDGTNSDIRFGFDYNFSAGLCMDANGNLYVSESDTNTIRKLTRVGSDWVSTTIAGQAGTRGYSDGTNSEASFSSPRGVVVDSTGNVYVADCLNPAIRKVSPLGPDWVTTTLAHGQGSSDGTNRFISVYSPRGTAVDVNDQIYFSDNNTIRRLTAYGTNWVCKTLAGSPGRFGTQDGTNSNIRFGFGSGVPEAVAVDSVGNLFVADGWNHNIRMVRPIGGDWVSSTIGGLAMNAGYADGIRDAARFRFPAGIAVSADGIVFVSDTQNNVIRMGRPVPGLAALTVAEHFLCSWPTEFTNYVLESSSSLGPEAAWTQVSNGLSIWGGRFVVTNAIDRSALYFRLHHN